MLHSCRADAISVSMENAAETIAPVDGRSRHHRSALTNGNRLFVLEGNADGRSASYRRFKDVLEQILADMGGAEHLSEAQRQLCRRAATLSIAAEAMESDAIGNKPFDVDLYGQLTDRLGRCRILRWSPPMRKRSRITNLATVPLARLRPTSVLAEIQSEADRAASAWGKSAVQPWDCEGITAYRRRVAA